MNLVGCTADASRDIVILELDLSIAQKPKVAISPHEQVAVYFPIGGDDLDQQPHFVPLREDFPDDVVHLMAGGVWAPPSLCIWDVPFNELRATLTPSDLVRQLKLWLERTSDGLLHEADQPLEPVMQGGGGVVIVPLNAASQDGAVVDVRSAAQWRTGKVAVRFGRNRSLGQVGDGAQSFILGVIQTPRRKQRAVASLPRDLDELRQILDVDGFDLLDVIRRWLKSQVSNRSGYAATPVLLITIPKVASDAPDAIPVEERWAFCVDHTMKGLGIDLGVFEKSPEHDTLALLLGPPGDLDLSKILIEAMIVVPEVERSELPALSGLVETGAASRFTLIGAGALGSKLLECATRSGFGSWTIIDEDLFFPHNAARHILGDWAVGQPKAGAVAEFANNLTSGPSVVHGLQLNVLAPGTDAPALSSALNDADAIVDVSASVPVARAIASQPGGVRRMSAFLNPQGTDLVLLVESADRTVDLWALEGAYYRAIAGQRELADHLAQGGTRRRYANGCRDRTAAIAADAVSVLGGIATRQIMRVMKEDAPAAGVWRYDAATGEVASVPIAVGGQRRMDVLGWQVLWLDDLVERMSARRLEKLPSETGGVLLGIVDRQYRRIVVVDEIPAPPDSLERPWCFERGQEGLDSEVERISNATAGQLRYIGEWHSHPARCPARPSGTDETLWSKLANIFNGSAEPFLMAILGDDELFARLGVDDAADHAAMDLVHQDR